MAFGTGEIIEDTDYTTVYNKIFNVYGRNDDGYGQIMAANPVGNNIIIYATEWQNLRSYVLNSRIHQIGTSATLNSISQGDVIHYANHLGQINTMANACVTDKRAIHSLQYSTEEKFTNTTTFTWGGGNQNRLNYAFYMQGANQHSDGAERGLRYFFNAGGVFKIRFTLTGGSGRKFNNWVALFNNIGTITINHNSISGAGNVISPPAGFYGIPTNNTQVEIFKRFASGESVYTENYLLLKAQRDGAGIFRFALNLVDADTGDKTGEGPAVDENVSGTTGIVVSQDRPSGSYVNVETPTYQTSVVWNTSNVPT
jgi:hypothetical protein